MLELSTTVATVAVVAFAIVFFLYIQLRAQFDGKFAQLQAELQLRLTREATDRARSQAREDFETWRQEHSTALEEAAEERARTELSKWRTDAEAAIRADARARARTVITGQVAENLAPFLPSFHYNPKDAHFLGNPIDFIVFDGDSAGQVRRIVLLEVKSQRATLTSKQKQIRDVILSGQVSFELCQIDELNPDGPLVDETFDPGALDRISVDDGVAYASGFPVTRIAQMKSNGLSDQDILNMMPFLDAEDIRQAMAYNLR